MADQKIPYEYQTDFGQIGNLEEIAKLMELQRQRNQEQMRGQMVSGHFIRMSPMQGLADMFAAYQGGKARREAARLRTELPQRMAADEKSQISKLAELMAGRPERQEPTPEWGFGPGEARQQPAVPANPLAAARFAAGSQFPRVQDFGKGISETVRNQTSAFASRLTPAGLEYMAQYGAVPPRQSGMWKPEEQWGEVENLAPPGSKDPLLGTREKGTGKVHFAPKASTTSVTVGDRGRGRILEKEHEYMMTGKGYEQGLAISKGIENVTSAMNVFSTIPMNTGIDADWKTIAQKLSQLTGQEVDPKAAGTELYQRYVVPMTADVIKGFGAGTGLSDADRKFALQAIAQASNDPRMAKVALAFMFRGLMKEAAAQSDRINRAKAAAAREDYDPEMFAVVPFSASLAPEFGLPEGFERPGVLEKWMKEVMKSKATNLQDAVTRNLGQP